MFDATQFHATLLLMISSGFFLGSVAAMARGWFGRRKGGDMK